MLDANQFFSGGEDEFYSHPINQSLRFNDNDSAYLSWTPESAGNRKTWTWSGWVKRGNLSSYQAFFSAGLDASNRVEARFENNDKLYFAFDNGTYKLKSTAVYRDASAWYHIVLEVDTTQSTASNRMKMYVNGEQVTALDNSDYPTQNYDTYVNTTNKHTVGSRWRTSADFYLDGYITEVNFIDGTALDADSFGETKSGVWIPKEYDGSYGTNGFYLPMSETTQANGFSAVTYTGTSSSQSVNNVGFSPDLVWIKGRENNAHALSHHLFDTVRGAGEWLASDRTQAEEYYSDRLTSFDSDGFSLGSDSSNAVNDTSEPYVAWCWDAGTGSAASNTDGSITSSVKANTDYGFSIVSYTGNDTDNATIGHGLNQAPDMVIIRNRDLSRNWVVAHSAISGYGVNLNDTSAKWTDTAIYDTDTLGSSVLTVGNSNYVNSSSYSYIAYCFHSVTGYSKFGSYTGNGSSQTITTGFRPALVIAKATSAADNWRMYDNVRGEGAVLYPNLSNAEDSATHINFTDTGFEWTTDNNNSNGHTYIYMAFADTKDAAFYYDGSGNKNNWTPAALTGTDVVPDSPTNTFCTMNPLAIYGTPVFSEGNLKVKTDATGWEQSRSTFGFSTGKWYYELVTTNRVNDVFTGIRLASDTNSISNTTGDRTGVYANHSNSQQRYHVNGGSPPDYEDTAWFATTGTILGVAIDMDNGKMYFYHDNVLQHTSTFSVDGEYLIEVTAYANGNENMLNFGQDSSFAGSKTAQGNTDDNGYGDFYYAPPSGYLALCTANLPEPEFSPADDESPQDHFNTVLYTGTGSQRNVIGVGFQPDFVWLKSRNAVGNNNVFDAVRGTTKRLSTDQTNAESTVTAALNAFISDGFSIGNEYGNNSSETYAAWNWKANGAGVANTDGTISSTVSANTEAGFSIVKWTADSSSDTVGHGLDKEPEIVIYKKLDMTDHWYVYTDITGTMGYLRLNDTNALTTNAGPTRTSTVIGALTSDTTDVVAYCFHSVDGFSKFGSYTGNGSTDGPFVYTGFRPAFVMYKNTSSAEHWIVLDSVRDPENVVEQKLYPSGTFVDQTGANTKVDYLSNGFKIRGTEDEFNKSGNTIIYMAFAENPFKYSNAR